MANGNWYPSGGRTVAQWKTHESKQVTWTTGGHTFTKQKVRVVDMKTVEYVGVFDSCPESSAVDANPTRNDTNTDVTYDSRVQWNPVTHKAVKTNTVRTSVNKTQDTDEGGWMDVTESTSS